MQYISTYIKPKLIFHHTGILVKNINDSILNYSQIFGKNSISDVYDIKSQKVKVCFIKLNDGLNLELVQPFEDCQDYNQYFKRNINYYHNGYMTEDFESSLDFLANNGLRLLNIFNSEAFENNRCAFLLTKEMHLFELIEK